ncbi:MAG: hypothetical protein QW820_07525, partial [Sulfolobales archaeon]
MFGKVVSDVGEVFRLIGDGSTIVISGFSVALSPEYLVVKLYEFYEANGRPKDLLIVGDALPAVPGRGLDLVARRVYECGDRRFL